MSLFTAIPISRYLPLVAIPETRKNGSPILIGRSWRGSLLGSIERIALAHSHRVADRPSKSLSVRPFVAGRIDRPCGTPFLRFLRGLPLEKRSVIAKTEKKQNVPTRSAYAKVCRPLDWTLKSQK